MKEPSIVIPVSALRRLFIMLVVLIALSGVVLLVRSQLVRPGVGTLFAPGSSVIDRAAYQAVFLTNGTTFFGKLEPEGDDFFLLSDVFYLASSDQSGTQLIKRGSEAQGPREPMIIPREQVVFVENMRDDSDVVNLIKRFKSGQLPAATPPPSTPRPSATR